MKYGELVRDTKEMRKKSRSSGSKRLFRKCILHRRYPKEDIGPFSDGHTSAANMYKK